MQKNDNRGRCIRLDWARVSQPLLVRVSEAPPVIISLIECDYGLVSMFIDADSC